MPAVDSLDVEAVEDDVVPVDGGRRHDSEEGDFAAVAHICQHVLEGIGAAGHFKTDVEAFFHIEFFLGVTDAFVASVHYEGRAHFLGQLEAIRVYVGDDDVTCAGVLCDCDGHKADRSCAGYQDVFADQVEGEGGVDGVAEGVEAGEDVGGYGGVAVPYVGDGDGKILGKGAVSIDADATWFDAEVAAAGEAIPAASADDVSLTADELADLDVVYVAADFFNGADEFVAYNQRGLYRLLRPFVPIEDVDVGAANRSFLDFYEDIVAGDRGDGYVIHPHSGFGLFLDECFHCSGSPILQRLARAFLSVRLRGEVRLCFGVEVTISSAGVHEFFCGRSCRGPGRLW